MGTDRITRINELLRREIGAALFRVLGAEDRVNLATLTVTRVETSRNLRQARVHVSISVEPDRRRAILQRIQHHAGELQAAINRDLKMKYTPRLLFQYDPGIERGDHVLELLASIEEEPTGGEEMT